MLSTRKLVALGAVLAIAASGTAFAQTTPDLHSMGSDQQHMMQSGLRPMDPGQMQEMMRRHQSMMGGHAGMHATSTTPTMPGQDAFGAIQEIVQILDADPKTDWSKVDLEALRQHLIDMNEVTLRADAAPKEIDGGLEIAVTGTGRTLVAIQRMIPAWAQSMNGHEGWSTKAASLPNGELLTVTATDPKEIQHIRGLGFIGPLVSGSHHQPHHLAIAKGEFDHEHLGNTH
jgi:TusA-related sulfurtransferase